MRRWWRVLRATYVRFCGMLEPAAADAFCWPLELHSGRLCEPLVVQTLKFVVGML